MKAIKIVLIVAIVGLVSAFTVKTEYGYKVGDTIEDFKLKNVNDNMVSLADYTKAKGFIIVFTCNMCPYSVANEDRLIALDKKYKEKGYYVIAINPNDPEASKGDDFESMKVRAKEKGFTFPYLFDEGQKVYPKFGASKTPHVYNSSRNESSVTEKYVENAVDALLEGKKLTKTKTRAIGCSIKKPY